MADDKRSIGNPDRNLIAFKEGYEFDYAASNCKSRSRSARNQHGTPLTRNERANCRRSLGESAAACFTGCRSALHAATHGHRSVVLRRGKVAERKRRTTLL